MCGVQFYMTGWAGVPTPASPQTPGYLLAVTATASLGNRRGQLDLTLWTTVPRAAVPDRDAVMQDWTYLTPTVCVDTSEVQNESKSVLFLGKEIYLKHNQP